MKFEPSKEYLERLHRSIASGDSQSVVGAFNKIHPADIAEVFYKLNSAEAAYVYTLLEEELGAEVLLELDEETREDLLSRLTSREIAERVIDNMDSDDAADVLSEMPDEQQAEIDQLDLLLTDLYRARAGLFQVERAALEAAPVWLEAELSPAMFGAAAVGAEGTPTDVPPAAMLSAFKTWVAAMVMSPVARMPASPASTVPAGAIRNTSPGSTFGTDARTPMPPPVASPPRSASTLALIALTTTRVGGAVTTVLAAAPAAMFPSREKIVRSPPLSVKIRAWPISTSSWV